MGEPAKKIETQSEQKRFASPLGCWANWQMSSPAWPST